MQRGSQELSLPRLMLFLLLVLSFTRVILHISFRITHISVSSAAFTEKELILK